MFDNSKTNYRDAAYELYSKQHFREVLNKALEFTCLGKGAERHGGGTTDEVPLQKQPWVLLVEKTKAGFSLGQAAKKALETLELESSEAKLKEIYGAISYLVFSAMYIEKCRLKSTTDNTE